MKDYNYRLNDKGFAKILSEYLMNRKDDIHNKWNLSTTSAYKINYSKELEIKISQYLEYVCFMVHGSPNYNRKELSDIIYQTFSELHQTIEEKCNRYEVIGHYYNPSTLQMEVKLKGDHYLPLNGDGIDYNRCRTKLHNILVEYSPSYFPIEFVELCDLEYIRDKKLDYLNKDGSDRSS